MSVEFANSSAEANETLAIGGVTLPAHYGYVVMVSFAAFVVAMGKGIYVGQARRKYGVSYPTMYAYPGMTKHQSSGEENETLNPETKLITKEEADAFNSVQRAHQNTLENIPHFLAFLYFNGLFNPIVTASIGATWVLGRLLYGIGYIIEPKGRIAGGLLSSLALVALAVYSVIYAVELF